jgi:putative intracellular protease/amidase
MEDLFRDPQLGKILVQFHAEGKPTGLICHAPIALLSAKEVQSPWIYEGYRLTVFSTKEEQQEERSGALDGELNYYVADALASAGAHVFNSEPWTSEVIRDRELITGQNPMSAEIFAEKFLEALQGN